MAVYWDQTDPQIINAYAAYFNEWLGVPPGTLESIAMAESSYNPQTGAFRNGCNWAGACGMFQIRRIMLQDIDRVYRYKLDPTDPIQGLVGAALAFKINARYLKHYSGRTAPWDALVAAYNGGWAAGYKYMAGRAIPYETRDYLVKVSNNMAAYA